MAPDSGEEHYFATHDVAGKTVTRTLSFDLAKKGYERKDASPYQITEVTIPVFDKTGEYVIRAARHDVPIPPEDQKKEAYTAIYIGGGTSDAVANVDQLARIEDAIKPVKDQLPFVINRFIGLPHLAGSPRTRGPFDAAKQKTMGESARIYETVLQTPELNVSHDGVILIGYSAGGTVAIELAGLLGERCKYLVLADSVGMADISASRLSWEFSLGTIFAAIRKYSSHGFLKALGKALWETRVAWGAIGSKVPGARDMLHDLTMTPRWAKSIGKSYGISGEQTDSKINIVPLVTDSTKMAREKIRAHVIFSPVLGAGVVDTIVTRLREKYPSTNAILSARPQMLEADVSRMLKGLFPQASGISFAGFRDITHSAVRFEPGFWKNIFATLAKTQSMF